MASSPAPFGFPTLRWPSLASVLSGVASGASTDAQTAGDIASDIGGALANAGQRTAELVGRMRSGEIDPVAFGKAVGGRVAGLPVQPLAFHV